MLTRIIMTSTHNFSPLEMVEACEFVKQTFQTGLESLGMKKVVAPLFVDKSQGVNDNLNNVERPVTFTTQSCNQCEIVQSLAKWKRDALQFYGINALFTNMTAIRKDEKVSPLHSYLVDQWDWEMTLENHERNLDYLKGIVRKLYKILCQTEDTVNKKYTFLKKKLPAEIHFIGSQELEDLYPNKTPSERETIIAKKYGAVFIIGIGGRLESGQVHDLRAPDYDDWKLDGDIIVYNQVLDIGMELSSMGIRVSPDSLKVQLEQLGLEQRISLPFHRKLIEGRLPLTVGGGIGQSRVCMLLLETRHIGEVQISVWPEKYAEQMEEEMGIEFLYRFKQ